MGLSGVSGPFTGAYQTFNAHLASSLPGATNSHTVWAYRVATGMQVTIFQAQASCNSGGNGGTVDVFDDGSTILTAPIVLATNTYQVGALATPLGVVVEAMSVLTATMSWGSGQAAVRDVTLSILWAPTGNTHPSSVRSAFE